MSSKNILDLANLFPRMREAEPELSASEIIEAEPEPPTKFEVDHG